MFTGIVTDLGEILELEQKAIFVHVLKPIMIRQELHLGHP